MSADWSDPAVAAFVAIPLLLVAALAWGVAAAWRRSGASADESTRAAALTVGAAAVWMALAWAAAASGLLQRWERTPPPFALLIAATLALAIALAFSPVGGRLARFVPLWALVLAQAFRLPLELAMHALYERGIMPRQMSFSGRNFDVVTGALALLVAALAYSGGARRLVAAWNTMGLALLANVVVVAILSTPRFRVFGPDQLSTFVTYTPYVWLPAVMVLAALAGHLVIFRALRAS
jgi:drug/metabolite transporter (DMT)-like permease